MAEIWVEHKDQAERDARAARPVIEGTTAFKAFQARPNLANKQRLEQVTARVYAGLQAETAARIEAEKKAGRDYKPFAQQAVEAFGKFHTEVLPRFAYEKLGLNKVTGEDFGELTKQARGLKNPFEEQKLNSDYEKAQFGNLNERMNENAELRAAQARVTATAGGLTRGVSGEFAKSETRLRDLMPKGRGREAVQEGEFHNEL